MKDRPLVNCYLPFKVKYTDGKSVYYKSVWAHGVVEAITEFYSSVGDCFFVLHIELPDCFSDTFISKNLVR